MTTATTDVRVLEQGVWIPLRSGVQLAARIWLPVTAEANPVPALLEYLPYRKRDLTRVRDEPIHRYFAEQGYASVRVDMRGSGDSFGVMHDEYELQEQLDAIEVIEWLAAQSWCSGSVGMFGVSWGGFNALQVAARRPKALKAIVTSCSTDDRYADDIHYMGGCLLVDNIDWGSLFLSILPMPGDPEIMGPGWRDNWHERLESLQPPASIWMQHPTRDEYWKHGSVNEDFAAIECPVLAVSGWLDGYSNAVPRLLENLSAPRMGVIGCHAHQFGFENRPPGPAWGFLQVAVQWWDRWLKDIDNGVDREPMLRAYVIEDVSNAPRLQDCPGRWVAEPVWPPPSREPLNMFLNSAGLQDAPLQGPPLRHSSLQIVGTAAGKWCPFGTGGGGMDFAQDQSVDDALSLCFDGDPLTQSMDILGAPEVCLDVAVDKPIASLAVRLNDVRPDGVSTRVTYGVLNLAHREGHANPIPIVPGERYRIRIRLNDIAYRFAAGHRLRISLSTCYWPVIWPAPEPVELTLYPGSSELQLPVRAIGVDPHSDAITMPAPTAAPGPATEPLEAPPRNHQRNWDLNSGYATTVSDRGSGLFRFRDNGIITGRNTFEKLQIQQSDPLSAKASVRVKATTGREGWRIEIDTETRLTADQEHFILESDLDILENGAGVFSRRWTHRFPRGSQ